MRVNVCRPGFGASCALCCGSHNYQGTEDEIGDLFRRRRAAADQFSRAYLLRIMKSSRSPLTGSYYYAGRGFRPETSPPLCGEGRQCPFVGCVGEEGVVGCLRYPETPGPELRRDCYQNYRSKIFTCPAREILSQEEVLYAARLTADWYCYSLLIQSTSLLRSLREEYSDPDLLPPGRLESLRWALEDRVRNDPALHCLDSYFG